MVKSGTEQEFMFRMLVTDLIRSSAPSAKERGYQLLNFWNQSEFYYDIFCESVYMLMTDDSIDSISIDFSGYTRFDFIVFSDDFYSGYELLTKADIRDGSDDLIVYVDIALSRLKGRLKRFYPDGFYSGTMVVPEQAAVN